MKQQASRGARVKSNGSTGMSRCKSIQFEIVTGSSLPLFEASRAFIGRLTRIRHPFVTKTRVFAAICEMIRTGKVPKGLQCLEGIHGGLVVPCSTEVC
jgi:hypothetical protein